MKIVSLIFGMFLAVSVANAQQIDSSTPFIKDVDKPIKSADELYKQSSVSNIVIGDKVTLEQGKGFGKQILYYNPNYKKSSRYIAPIEPMYKKEEVKIELYNPELSN